MQRLTSSWQRWTRDYLPPPGRTGELFLKNLDQIQARTDRLLYFVLLIQYPAAIALALIWSPLAWAGSVSSTHFHVWLATIFGGLITSLPIYLIRTNPSASLTRHVIAIAQMLMGALLIHLSGGRIETHFHVFGSLAFLAFYRDVPVLATATVVVVVDHLVRGVFIPNSVYGMISASHWRFVEHAFWVVFENIFLVISCVHGRAQLGAMASQQAQLEEVNQNIEAAVRMRTQELALRTEELAAARDAAVESTRLKSQFLANVSHEIRTPMNGVLGMTGVLLDTELTSEQRECAVTVQHSAQRLLTVINDILDFSKIEAGKLVLETSDFLIRDEINDVVRLCGESAARKQLRLSCEIHPDVPYSVTGHPARFRQILVNLVSNAIKFTETGEVKVCVVQADRNGNTSRIRVEVVDTGIGISAQCGEKLFEAFVQVDGSMARRHEGTGLGLAISKQLIHLMGGEIGFNSVPGLGSTFWFEVLVEVIPGSDKASDLQRDAPERLRVLVVDNRATARKHLVKSVQTWGMTAEEVAGATEAIKMLERALQRGTPFDLVLINLRLPNGDGVQLAEAVRSRTSLKSTHLVLLTSPGQSPVSDRILPADVVTCPVEPTRSEELFLTIGKLFDKGGLTNGAQPSPSKGVPRSDKPLSVLVAEDNLVNQRVLTALLERLGHRYEVVGDGAAAIEAVKQSDYDVVLMDCQMPRVDGFQATAEIRRLGGVAGQVPIIAVTANAMSGDRERCLDAGMTAYVPKPVQMLELAEALASAHTKAR